MTTEARTETKMLIAGVVAMVLLAAVLLAVIVAGVRATDADRAHRTARAEACRTIEDQTLRTLCLVNRP